MTWTKFVSIFLSFFALWLAVKLSYVLSPQNPMAELHCWSLQFLDSQLVPYEIYTFRPALKACTANLKHHFPVDSSWDMNKELRVVELTPQNMSNYFSTAKNALDLPFVIRGFMRQPGTEFDLSKFADVNYLRDNIQNHNATYHFDSSDKQPKTLTMPDALRRMVQGDGLYMKFNRDLTNNEPLLAGAIDKATDILRQQGGPVVLDALSDSIKVAFITVGDTMNTPIHNAMSANWFYQVAGTKDWKIYNPKHSIYLEPLNFPNAIASTSTFNTSYPNSPRHLSVTTYSGDFLYFPSFWLHEVDNRGPGLKLAIGLRPSIKGVRAMWLTALVPFFESPKDTTGLALCHLGPSAKIFMDL